MNPDGTVTIGSPLTLRTSVNPSSISQQQQIRIINSEDNQQIRVLNASEATGLSPGSFRIISSGGAMTQQQFDGGTRVRFVNSNSNVKSPVKAITLSQAQQMGLLSGGKEKKSMIEIGFPFFNIASHLFFCYKIF
jgi:hypothetical protein